LVGGAGLVKVFSSMGGRLKSFFELAVRAGSGQEKVSSVSALTGEAAITLLELIAPILALAVGAAALAGFLHIGPLWSREAARPRMSRVNPMKGLKEIFSLSNLVGLCKSTVVSLLILAVATFVFLDSLRVIVATPTMTLHHGLSAIGLAIIRVASAMAGIIVLAAVVDFIWARWRYQRALRMSRYEMLKELRETEGDPHLRARQKKRHQLAALGQRAASQEAVEVLLLDRGRVGVLIAYHPGSDTPPSIKAVVYQAQADRLANHCRRQGMDLLVDAQLARALARLGIGAIVSEALFSPLAELMASASAGEAKQPR